MKKVIYFISILLSLTINGRSQDLTKKDKIRNLFTIMHQDSIMIKTINMMSSAMVTNLKKQYTDSTNIKKGIDISGIAQNYMEKSKELVLLFLNNDMVDIYDKYFTTEEIDDFINFYKSKSGQKLLTQMPEMQKEIMITMMTKYQNTLQKLFIKDIQDKKASGGPNKKNLN